MLDRRTAGCASISRNRDFLSSIISIFLFDYVHRYMYDVDPPNEEDADDASPFVIADCGCGRNGIINTLHAERHNRQRHVIVHGYDLNEEIEYTETNLSLDANNNSNSSSS